MKTVAKRQEKGHGREQRGYMHACKGKCVMHVLNLPLDACVQVLVGRTKDQLGTS